jgi:hypothetical protein
MADHDHASETGQAHANDAPRRAAAPAKEAGATSAAAGTASARAAAPDATRSPDAASLGARQVKAKMVAGAASDPAEREADRTAGQVLRMAAPEQNRPAAVDPTVADASSRGPGRATSVPPGPQRQAAAAASGPPTRMAAETTAGTPPGPAAGTAPGPVRRQAVADHDPHGAKEVPEETQRYLDRSQGTGSPLPDGSRRYFEARFSTDFGGVRVHDDDAADQAARSIGALAFTRGNDIWFSAGAYDPVTDHGRQLLAHELAHIAQQYPGIGRSVDEQVSRASAGAAHGIRRARAADGPVIRRAAAGRKAADIVPDDQKGPTWTAPPDTKPQGSIDTDNKTLVIDELPFPRWKEKASNIPDGPYRWRREKRPSTPQLENWKKGVRDDTKAKTKERLNDLYGEHAADEPYFAKSGNSTDRGKLDFYVGSPEQIAEMILVPTWSRTTGEYNRFDVDHKIDWQLYGGDDFPNIWLFDREINQAEGTPQLRRMQGQIDSFFGNAMPYLKPRPRSSSLPGFAISFKKLKFEGSPAKAGDFWEKEHAGTQAHVRGLQKLSPKEIKDLGGREDNLQIFSAAGGGRVRRLPYDTKEKKPKGEWIKTIGKNQLYEVQEVNFEKISDKGGTGNVGQVKGIAFKDGRFIEKRPFKVDLNGLPGLPYAASLTTTDVRDAMKVRGLSPVTFEDLEFDPFDGFIGHGKILPSAKLLERVDVDLVLSGRGVGIEANITGGDLGLPGPFRVTGGLLSLYAGTDGLAVTGKLNFEIEKVATGFIRAKAGTSTGFALDAELQFDKKMFDGDAKVKGSYEDGKWAVEGTLGVGPNKIKGIKKASATVKVTDDTVTADGEFETSLKGVDKGKLSFKYNEATGMEISGEIILGKGIPGIKSGKLGATVKEGPTGHSLSGDVTLEPSVPGLTGTVTGKYEDGAFLVEADLGYEKDLAKGSVKVGLTNQAPGPDGKPAGPPKPDGSLTVYGGGTVTLTLTPWLQGTVGLKLTERGEVEVSGEVALPSAFEVFKERTIEKQLLSIGIDIPIIGVAVAGQRIGIFATIRGGVSISAGFGPGELRDVALKVTYNPARPDDTTVSGRGNFVVPAHAGLRLSVDGGLGAGIPVVSATAGITVYGEIGVAGAASAGVVITWTPRSGIVLDAKGEIFVEPKFKFGVEAFVDVSADLWITTIELYHHKWKLADFEYGSNLRFGLSLPIHYESGKPFDISFDQIQWTYPHIEPSELLGGLMKQLVG